MSWNPDAPIEMLDRASRVVWELCGPAPYLNWLEQEVSRTKIYLNYKTSVIFFASTEASGARDPQQPKPPPLAATGAASSIVDEMVETLRWYADAHNYIQTPPGGSTRIAADCGQKAERTLAKYDAGELA